MKEETKNKMKKFFDYPSKELLLTLEEYNELNPSDKGFWCYIQSSWEESTIPPENPYDEGTEEHQQFNIGEFQAMMCCQDYEE
jgi:hypothetical protein